MAIVPTWRHLPQPPDPPPLGAVGHIAKALRDRDGARAALCVTEQRLAAVVAQQPPYYQRAWGAFRTAGGATAEQWEEWIQHLSIASDGLPGLRYQRLRLAHSRSAAD
jgi:hypothetical protein